MTENSVEYAEFESPNLDAQDNSTLVFLAQVFDALALYARAKNAAMQFRAAGNITRALQLEEECDSIYRTIPPAYRW